MDAGLILSVVGSGRAIALALVLVAVAVHLVPYLRDRQGLRQYPGPLLAKLSRFWLVNVVRSGHRYRVVHELHQRYGPIVRIGPNELSIADPAAIPAVLGQHSQTLKSDAYDAFVVGEPSILSTRSRAVHARKLKLQSAAYSQTNIRDCERYIAANVSRFLGKWDQLCDSAAKMGDDRTLIDAMSWLDLLAFDIMGDLALGAPFGTVEAGRDIATTVAEDGTVMQAPGIKIMTGRNMIGMVMAHSPPWIRPYISWLDLLLARRVGPSVNFLRLAKQMLNRRLREGPGERKDLLAKLQVARDEAGQPISKRELLAETVFLLSAGFETTAISATTILWWIVKHRHVHATLLEELDARLGHVDGVVSYDDCRDLRYLTACINEGLRRHSTVAMGLPRVITNDVELKGKVIKSGTVVGVPIYEVHHDQSIYGDPWTFRPERWLEPGASRFGQGFIPFSTGPFRCIGRNLAMLDLYVVLATLLLRYDFVLKDPDAEELESQQAFARKPLRCWFGIKRRSGGST